MATPPVLPEDKFVEVNGNRIHYLDWGGDKTKKPFYMLHGIGGHAHSFDELAPHFLETHHVIAIDERGCGDSDWVKEGGYSAQAFATDIGKFAEITGLYPFDYYGSSQGSRIGMPVGAFYGQYVDHLVLGDYGPLPDQSPAGKETAQKRLSGGPRVEKPKGFFSPQQAFNWHKENDPRSGETDGEIWAAVENLYRTNWDGILIPKTDPEMWWQNGRTALKEGDFMWHSVKNISCKTLVLRGEISTVLDKDQAEKMAEAIPNGNGSMREVPGAGHGLHGENMEGALEILREFLAS